MYNMDIEELAKGMDYLQLEKLIKAYVKSAYSNMGDWQMPFEDYKELFVDNIKEGLIDLEEN